MAVAGKAAITLSTENGGAWSAYVTYDKLVAVKHNNSLYISRKVVTNVEPPNDEFWFFALEGYRGEDVQALIDSMNAIINGTTQVGNAKTLDGHGAEYFAKAEELDNIQSISTGTPSQAGWYRVAEMKGNADGLKGSPSNTVDLFIKRMYGVNNNEYHYLRLRSTYGKQSIVSLDDKSNDQLFTKARYSYNLTEQKAYLEVYYSSSNKNICIFELSHVYSTHKWQAISPTLTSETVEGVTVTTTYDIPANASPVTNLDLANYLPLTSAIGKEIKVNSATPIVTRNTSGTPNYFHYYGKDVDLGYLGFSNANIPAFMTSGGLVREFIHAGNKPTGTYTGNGDATQRTIATGGIGEVCLVYSANGVAIVTNTGTTIIPKSGDAIYTQDVYLNTAGTIVIASDNVVVNESGATLRYQVL